MIDLDALDALEAEATQGRWKIETGQCEWGTGAAAIGPYHYAKEYDEDTDESGEWLWEVDARKDADFINAVRNNYRAMAAELRISREVIEYFGKFFPFSPLIKKYDEVTHD